MIQRMGDRYSMERPWRPVVGEVPTKRSSDHDPMIQHCRIIGRFES